MKNVSHKKKWNTVTVQVHVDPPSIEPIKSKNYDKSEKYCVKIKLRRGTTSQKFDLYKLKNGLF